MEGVAYIEGETQLNLPSEPLSKGGFALHRGQMSGNTERIDLIVQRVSRGLELLNSSLIVDEV